MTFVVNHLKCCFRAVIWSSKLFNKQLRFLYFFQLQYCFYSVSTTRRIYCVTMCICYIHWIMDNTIPNHKLLSRTELDTKTRQTPFSEKSRPWVKKTYYSKPNALLQKKEQTNPLFEDENRNKITFKSRDFYSANVLRNLKLAFTSVWAIISKFFIFALTL